MGIVVYSLLWVMQDLYHQPYYYRYHYHLTRLILMLLLLLLLR